MIRSRFFLTAALFLATGVGASGYALLGSKWSSTPVTMHLGLGESGPLIDGSTSWNQVATAALGVWNYYLLRLEFAAVPDSSAPGDRDGANNVFFSDTLYGQDFGDAVAVTTEWDVVGSNHTVRSEADVIFNSKLSWNSYRGPFRFTASGSPIYDLRRIALHEFGHVVGLDHPDEAGQSVVAVMNSRVSDTDSLQKDDVRGGQYLYGAEPGTFVGEIATIERPRRPTDRTGSGMYLFSGFADTDRVQSVYLVNSRTGNKKVFKARGVDQWKLNLKLQPGRNVVTLYVRGLDGVRQKVTKRTVLRTGRD